MKIKNGLVVGLFLNMPHTHSLKLKLLEENKFITELVVDMAGFAPELGVLQDKLTKIDALKARAEDAVWGAKAVLRPAREPEVRIQEHFKPVPAPTVVRHWEHPIDPLVVHHSHIVHPPVVVNYPVQCVSPPCCNQPPCQDDTSVAAIVDQAL